MINVLDTTLREGELHPGIKFTHDNRMVIAEVLAKIGVPRIEFSMVYPSRGGRVKDINEAIDMVQGYGAIAVLQFRAFHEDLEMATKYHAYGAAPYLGISKAQSAKTGLGQEDSLERMVYSMLYLKDHGFEKYRRAVFEDSARFYTPHAEPEDTMEKYERYLTEVKNAGATVISVPDTIGLLNPQQAQNMMRKSRSILGYDVEIAGHFHNDYGLSLANSLAVITNGDDCRVDEIHCSIRGIGARNGITDLYELVANLEDNFEMSTGVQRSGFRDLYDLFSREMRMGYSSRESLAPNVSIESGGSHQKLLWITPRGSVPPGKLEHDIKEIKFEASDIMSKEVVSGLTKNYGLGNDAIQRIIKKIADWSVFRSRKASPPVVRDIIEGETNINLSYEEVRNVVSGGERGYLLVRLDPQYPAEKLVVELYEMKEVEKVNQTYGTCDMVIEAELYDENGKSTLHKIETKYKDIIENIESLIIE
jgi:2-isopropylmalate synthase